MTGNTNLKINTAAKNKTSRSEKQNVKAQEETVGDFVSRTHETKDWKEAIENCSRLVHLIVLEILFLILLILEAIVFLKEKISH